MMIHARSIPGVPIIKQAQQHQTITINQMDSTTVECTASGIPSPTVRWINSNSQSVDQTSLEGSSTLILRDVTFTHEGTYLCIAQNMLVNPPLGKRVLLQVWQVTVNVEGRWYFLYNLLTNSIFL